MKRIIQCSWEGCTATAENPDLEEPLCASHSRAMRKASNMKVKEKPKPIKKVGDKMAKILSEYGPKRDAFLRGKPCAMYPDKPATTVHHMMGKVGFADEWARERDIPLWLDERYWLPVSMEAHVWIELNPDEAKEKGYSLNRLDNHE